MPQRSTAMGGTLSPPLRVEGLGLRGLGVLSFRILDQGSVVVFPDLPGGQPSSGQWRWLLHIVLKPEVKVRREIRESGAEGFLCSGEFRGFRV